MGTRPGPKFLRLWILRPSPNGPFKLPLLDVYEAGLFDHSLHFLEDHDFLAHYLEDFLAVHDPFAHDGLLGDGVVFGVEAGGEFGLFDPSAGLESAVAFGVEGGPGAYAAKQGADVDEVEGVGIERPGVLVGVIDFEPAIGWCPLCYLVRW